MTRAVVFGTFDIFHPGHVSFLKQARREADYLLVVVARDQSVKTAKGQLPRNSEVIRLRNVRKANLANKVMLGSKTHNYFRTLRTHKIDQIVLGYDQKPTIVELKKMLKRHRLTQIEISRAKAYNPSKFKSSKLAYV